MDQTPESFTTQDLVAFVFGEADVSLSARIAAATSNDVGLQKQLARVQMMVQSIQSGVFDPAPRALKKAAVELFQTTRVANLADWLSGIAQSTLSLVFDSRSTPQLAGFRGQTEAHHMTFAVDSTEVDLLIEGEGDARTVRGQVTGFNATSVAGLGRDDVVLGMADVDKSGTFVLHLNEHTQGLCVKGDGRAFRLDNVLSL